MTTGSCSESLLANIEVVKDESQKGPIEAATSLRLQCSAATLQVQVVFGNSRRSQRFMYSYFQFVKSLQKEDN